MNLLSLASLLLLVTSAYGRFDAVDAMGPQICMPKGAECLPPPRFNDEIQSGSFLVYNMKGLYKEYMEFFAKDENVAEESKKCSVVAKYIDANENSVTGMLFSMPSKRIAEAVLMHNQTAKVPVNSLSHFWLSM
ncbi:hypothetical protein DFS34DRAFT_188252 [Phlyctochytrium arcticum]|nr:hypothetical protein DFS34DRAFT_188252 [Phlyctochytrium arcticum]